MPRILPVTTVDTPPRSEPMLTAVVKKFGRAPNLIQTLAHSPAALKFYLSQSEALSEGALVPQLRQQIALVVAGINRCDYCVSAHTVAGKGAGITSAELASNLSGHSENEKTQAALDLAKAIVTQDGQVSDSVLQAVRHAGFNEAEIEEIIAHVGMNIFTNYFNHIAATVNDFPFVGAARNLAD